MDKLKRIIILLLIILIVLLVILGLVFTIIRTHKPTFLYRLFGGEVKMPYYLVYVNSGSGSASYYGQIKKEEKDYLILKDPAYLNIQSPEKEGDQPKITLQLMKDEFFRPLPEMKIYKNAIVFIQQLSEDSPILSAYRQFQNK